VEYYNSNFADLEIDLSIVDLLY